MATREPVTANERARTLFVVDDSPAIRRSLVALGEANGLVVKTYDSCEKFLAKYDPDVPGCLVLDLRFAKGSGLDLLEELVRRKTNLEVLVMTAHGTVETAVRAMKFGALEFLRKPVPPRRLLALVENAIRSSQARQGTAQRKAAVSDRERSLTPREREVADLLVKGKSSKEIGSALDISERTVEGYRRVVFRKMAVSCAAELATLYGRTWQTSDRA